MKTCGIYKIINAFNGKYYVGSSNNITKRWSQHKKTLNSGLHVNSHFQNSWNKYGKDTFFIKTEEEVLQGMLLIVEQKYLDIAKTEPDKCYNKSFIAGRVDMTDEVRKKLSISHKGLLSGEKHPMFGKHIGEKSGMYGKHHSEEVREKIRLNGIGRNHSNETKEKMRKSKLGKKYSTESVLKSANSRSKCWSFINPTGQIVSFRNLSSFCRENSLDKSAMSNVFKNKSTHHKGWKSTILTDT